MLNFVSLFEPQIALKKRTCGLRRSEVIRSEIKSKGLPDVLICGKGEKELAAELIDGWLDRRKHGIQSDLHLFASEADEEIRSRCQLEFANHCQISIDK